MRKIKDFTISLSKDKIEIKDLHFDLKTRIRMIFSLLFTGYLSFYTIPSCKIKYTPKELDKLVNKKIWKDTSK